MTAQQAGENAPFYSIIITTYNSASTIEACISSILVQEYENFEVLIQDGNSGDDTVRLVQRHKDVRIKLITKADSGIYDAMNKALDRSSGSWIFFLGSDDTLYSRDVLKQVHGTVTASPESRFVYGDVYTSENQLQRYNRYNYKKLLNLNICHQAIFYHRSLFDNIRYSLQYKIFSDWDVNLTVFRSSNHPVYTGLPVANFNLSGTSARWYNDPEYLQYFSDKKALALHYRGRLFWWYYRLSSFIHKIIRS